MLKNITLGQYFPGNSFIHRLDPRTKIIFVIVYIAALFIAKSWVSYAVVIALLIVEILLTKIRLSVLLNGLKPVVIIIIFTAVLNIFFTDGTPIFTWWKIKVTYEGLYRAALMVIRIMLLICGTLILTYTTSPIALTDGIERLLSPLKKLKVPVHEFAMMMSLALRFIPTLIEETDKIMSAQKARGADFETGSLLEKAKALLPLLVPLFVSAFRRADELAIAMESRCYQGGDGRTQLRVLKFGTEDVIAFIVGFLVLAGVIVLAAFNL